MKRNALLMTLMFALVGALIAPAQARRDADGYWIWQRPGGNPRVPGGINSREEFTSWFLGAGGQNDGRRMGVPKVVQEQMSLLVRDGNWEDRVDYGDSRWGELSERTSLRGSVYKSITFADGKTIQNVKTAFDADIFRVEAVDQIGVLWRWDTFQICGNAGLQTVSVVTVFVPKEGPKGPPGERGPQGEQGPAGERGPQGEAILAFYYPPITNGFTLARATTREEQYPGILSPLAYVLGQWLGRAKYAFNVSATGGSGGAAFAEGGSAASSSSSAASASASAAAAAAAGN